MKGHRIPGEWPVGPFLSPLLYVYSIAAGTSTKLADSGTPFFASDDGSVIAYNPARAGEVVHLYAQNLGAVSAPPAMGLAAPAATLSTVAAPIACVVALPASDSSAAAEVLFAGLAPGMFGVYQLDLRVPGLAGPGWATVNCHVGTVAQGFDFIGYLPFQSAN